MQSGSGTPPADRSGKRQRARKHLVEGDAQRVEIAAGINRALHARSSAPAPCRRAAGNNLGRYARVTLVRNLGCNP